MVNLIRLLLLIIVLFLGENVAHTFNFDYKIILVVLFLFSLTITLIDRTYRNRYAEIFLIIFIAAFTLYKIVYDGSDGTRMIGFNLLISPVMFLSLPVLTKTNIFKRKYFHLFKNMMVILLLFFGVEAGVAIYERLNLTNIFMYIDGQSFNTASYGIAEFRAISIHGHPLQNALILSTIMNFILFSQLKGVYKNILWFTGFLAILCFNSRASVLINIAMFVVYMLKYLIFTKGTASQKIGSFIVYLLLILSVGYFIVNGLIGGRLLNGLNDSSSQVRIEVWNIFHYYSLNNFMFGVDYDTLQSILYTTGTVATENFWLDWLFSYGAIFIVVLVLLYYRYIKIKLIGFNLFNKFLLTFSFLILASTNNSLSVSPVPIIVFFLCVILFSPRLLYLIVDKKYLTKKANKFKM